MKSFLDIQLSLRDGSRDLDMGFKIVSDVLGRIALFQLLGWHVCLAFVRLVFPGLPDTFTITSSNWHIPVCLFAFQTSCQTWLFWLAFVRRSNSMVVIGSLILITAFLNGLSWLPVQRAPFPGANNSVDKISVHESYKYPALKDELSYCNRAVLRDKQGDMRGAVDDLSEAIKLDTPDKYWAYTLRGNLLCSLKDFAGAHQDFETAISLDKSRDSAYVQRAWLRYDLRDLDGAIRDFSLAIELSHKRSRCYQAHLHANRGILHGCHKSYESATAGYSKALELHGDFDADCQKFKVLWLGGRSDSRWKSGDYLGSVGDLVESQFFYFKSFSADQGFVF